MVRTVRDSIEMSREEDLDKVTHELNSKFRVVDGVVKRIKGTEVQVDTVIRSIQQELVLRNLTYGDIETVVNEWISALIVKQEENREASEAIINGETTLTMTKHDDMIFSKFKWFIQEGQQVIVTNLPHRSFFKADNSNTYSTVPSTVRMALSHNPAMLTKARDRYNTLVHEAKQRREVPPFMIWKMNSVWSETSGRWRYPRENYNFEKYLDTTEEHFLQNSNFCIDEPAYITNDPKVAAFLHIDPNTFTSNDCPTWDNWINLRFNDEDKSLFKASIYSIFDPNNKSRQGIWMYDGGSTGKSTIISILYEFLNKSACALSNAEITGESARFTGSKILGKRLAVIPDCKNYSVIRSGIIFNILGNDPINIEQKGKQAYSSRVHCRVLIGANKLPEIDITQPSEKSRILIFKLRENNELSEEESISFRSGAGAVDREKLLLRECESFIASCKEDYTRHYGEDGGNLILDKDKEKAMFEMVTTPEVESFNYVIDDYIDISGDEDDTTPRIVLQSLFKCVYPEKQDKFTYGNFTRFIEGKGVKMGFKTRQGTIERSRVWKGMKLRTNEMAKHPNCIKDMILEKYMRGV